MITDSISSANKKLALPNNKKSIENSKTNLLFEQAKETQENKKFDKAIKKNQD